MHTYRRVRLASGFKNGKAAEKDGDESGNGDEEANGGSNRSGSVGRCLGISLNEVSTLICETTVASAVSLYAR